MIATFTVFKRSSPYPQDFTEQKPTIEFTEFYSQIPQSSLKVLKSVWLGTFQDLSGFGNQVSETSFLQTRKVGQVMKYGLIQ
jgi:hypothetical protein